MGASLRQTASTGQANFRSGAFRCSRIPGTHPSHESGEAEERTMAKRVAIGLLAPGIPLALLLPILGVVAMITGGILFAIVAERELTLEENRA
jgi:hypothetical protein